MKRFVGGIKASLATATPPTSKKIFNPAAEPVDESCNTDRIGTNSNSSPARTFELSVFAAIESDLAINGIVYLVAQKDLISFRIVLTFRRVDLVRLKSTADIPRPRLWVFTERIYRISCSESPEPFMKARGPRDRITLCMSAMLIDFPVVALTLALMT